MADFAQESRKAGNISAAREKFAQTPQEDHHRERSEDRMRAEIGDRRAHGCARRAADGQRRPDADDEGQDARLRPAVHVEDPGQGQAAEVRGGDDRQIDSAGHDRREHRQGEQAQIGQLKADRIEIRGAQKVRRRQAEGDHGEREQPEESRHLSPKRAAQTLSESRHDHASSTRPPGARPDQSSRARWRRGSSARSAS